MLFSLVTGSGSLFDTSTVLALVAATLLAAATIWMAHRVTARTVTTRGDENRAARVGWRAQHVPVLVRARRPDVPGRPRPRAPGAGEYGAPLSQL